jgi:hypothetical protein
MSLDDYLKLLDWVGRQKRRGKRGAIPGHLAPILERIGLASDEFLEAVDKFPGWFRRFAGDVEQFTARAKEIGRRALHGVSHAARLFRGSS